MNTTTLTTIQNAADFLAQFRRLPRYVQDLVCPHLNQPQQTALRILDCCSELDAVLTADIAAIAQLSKETTRQVLTTFDGKLVTAEDTLKGKAWKLRRNS